MKKFSYIPTLHLIGQLGRSWKRDLDSVIYCGFQINQTAHIPIEDEKLSSVNHGCMIIMSVALMDVSI